MHVYKARVMQQQDIYCVYDAPFVYYSVIKERFTRVLYDRREMGAGNSRGILSVSESVRGRMIGTVNETAFREQATEREGEE